MSFAKTVQQLKRLGNDFRGIMHGLASLHVSRRGNGEILYGTFEVYSILTRQSYLLNVQYCFLVQKSLSN